MILPHDSFYSQRVYLLLLILQVGGIARLEPRVRDVWRWVSE